MGWGDVREGAGRFLRWDDAPFEVCFSGEPGFSEKHYVGGRYIDCEPDECRYCSRGDKPKRQHVFTVVTAEGEEKVLTMTDKAAAELGRLRQELGPRRFEQTLVRCSRVGSGFKVVYRFEVAGEARG